MHYSLIIGAYDETETPPGGHDRTTNHMNQQVEHREWIAFILTVPSLTNNYYMVTITTCDHRYGMGCMTCSHLKVLPEAALLRA